MTFSECLRLSKIMLNSNHPLISIKNLTKTYVLGEQIVNALKCVSLDIDKGEYVALMGPSGSGKSTLMNIMGCLDSPSHGEYWLNQKEVSKMSDSELSGVRNEEIGFVFQTFNLLNRMTALENVALPLVYSGVSRKDREERASLVLERVGLQDRMLHKPNELSGGQRQRVAVARALVNNPNLLLADEPTGNLDTKTSHEIMALFEEIHNQGNTIVLVTHEEDIAQHAKSIIRLRDGMIEKSELTVG